MKVYAVATGEYSDFWVDNIFATRKLAEDYVKIHNLGSNYGRIIEYDLLDETTADIQGVDEYHPWISIVINKNGENITPEERAKDILSKKDPEKFNWFLKGPKDIINDHNYYIHVMVQVDKYDWDYDRIVKAAYDIRAKYLAEKLGL